MHIVLVSLESNYDYDAEKTVTTFLIPLTYKKTVDRLTGTSTLLDNYHLGYEKS